MSTAGANEIQLSDPPTDGISSVCFAPASDLLLASSWDSVSECTVNDSTVDVYAGKESRDVRTVPC